MICVYLHEINTPQIKIHFGNSIYKHKWYEVNILIREVMMNFSVISGAYDWYQHHVN